ncbi:LysR family transcriptional regulator, partial [Kingella denitrificans]
MQDKFAGIEEFLATVETGSFSAAVSKLDMTGSAVGKSITRLEKRLNTQLFHRSTRRLTLTREGEVWLAACLRMTEEMEQVQNLFSSERQEPIGSVRVDLPTTYGRNRLLPKLLVLAERHPRLHLDISFQDRKTDLIAEHIDVAVRFGEPDDSADVIARKIDENRNRVCAAPGYLARCGAPQIPEDLVQHACISGSASHWLLQDGQGAVQTCAVSVRHQMNDGDARLQAVLAGCGIAQLPDWLIQPYLAQGRLVPLLDSHALPPEPICVLWQKKQHL